MAARLVIVIVAIWAAPPASSVASAIPIGRVGTPDQPPYICALAGAARPSTVTVATTAATLLHIIWLLFASVLPTRFRSGRCIYVRLPTLALGDDREFAVGACREAVQHRLRFQIYLN